MKTNNDLGIFIRQKRIRKQISLRALSREIGVSPVYVSNIETGVRSAPSMEILLKISKVLILSKDEQEYLFDLAAESKNTPAIANDLIIYINENKIVHDALRNAKRLNISDEDWNYFLSYIANKYK